MANEERILAQLKNEEGKNLGAPIDLPLDVTAEGLQTICNALQENVSKSFRRMPLVANGTITLDSLKFTMYVTKLSVWFLFFVTPESFVSYLDAN